MLAAPGPVDGTWLCMSHECDPICDPTPPIRIRSPGLLPDVAIVRNCITLHLVAVGFNLLNKRLHQVTPRSLLDLGFFLAFCGRLKDSGLASRPWEPREGRTANPGAGREGCHRSGLRKAKSKALLGPGSLRRADFVPLLPTVPAQTLKRGQENAQNVLKHIRASSVHLRQDGLTNKREEQAKRSRESEDARSRTDDVFALT